MKFFLILTFFIQFSYADQLPKFCSKKSGVLLSRYKCPQSGFILFSTVCEYKDLLGQLHFVNGCSGPSGGFENIFFKACIKHDLCYHHEPSTYGRTQEDCDNIFLKMTMLSCLKNAENKKKCIFWAKLMHKALRAAGSHAFRCSDTKALY